MERLNRCYKRTLLMRGAMPSPASVVYLLGSVAKEKTEGTYTRRLRIFKNGKSSKTTKKYQHHKFRSGLGYPKPERRTKENLTHFFRHYQKFTERIFGKLVADKGYISQSLFEELFVDDIHLITHIRKNIKNSLIHLRDKILLRKRSLIETVNDEWKNIVQIEHTRHRSIGGFAANLMAAIAAYSFLPKKPSLNIEIIERERRIA